MSDIEVGSRWIKRSDSDVVVVTEYLNDLISFKYCNNESKARGSGSKNDFIKHFKLLDAAPLVSDTPAQSLGTMLGGEYFCSNIKYNTYGKQASQVVGKKMHLIGIAGQARSGKDTLASHLLANLDNWSCASFADPLKAMLSVIGVDCSDDAKAVIDECFGVTPRHMMQTLGTEWGRHLIDSDIWVKAFARLNAGKCVIVPDVRFENEADLVRANGVLIHLVGRGGIGGAHVSENPISFKEGDIVIDNSRDLAWLYAQVDSNAVLGDFISEVNK